VTRKAKGLQTWLGKLKEALDDPYHPLAKEDAMAKESL
jgi:hypothetical protein